MVKRLRFHTRALLEGSITPAVVAEDWADWFDLVGAFVAAYASEETEELARPGTFSPRVGFSVL